MTSIDQLRARLAAILAAGEAKRKRRAHCRHYKSYEVYLEGRLVTYCKLCGQQLSRNNAPPGRPPQTPP